MNLSELLKNLIKLKDLEGKNSVSLKLKLFGQLVEKSDGLIFKFFNLSNKAELNVSSATVTKSLSLVQPGESIDLVRFFQIQEQLAKLVGPGSIKLKISLLAKVFYGLSEPQVLILRDYYQKNLFKIGFSEKLALKWLSLKYPNETILKGLTQTNVPLFQLFDLLSKGNPIKLDPTLRPMLASSGVLKEKPYAVELKLDGVRILLERKNSIYKCWTRSGLKIDPTRLFDSIPKKDKQAIEKVEGDFILDGELWIPNLKAGQGFRLLLPIIKSKKVNIKAYYHCFDLLYFKKSLIDLDYLSRKSLLKSLNVPFVPHVVVRPGPINKLLDKFKKSIYEGLVCKELESCYEPGKRSTAWVKLKPQPDSIDVKVISAQRGTGKYKKYYASFDIAVLDGSKLVPIGKVGSGFTQEDLAQMTERYDKNLETIIEVESEAFVLGALRFPRFKRIRYDKLEINTLDQLKQIYNYN